MWGEGCAFKYDRSSTKKIERILMMPIISKMSRFYSSLFYLLLKHFRNDTQVFIFHRICIYHLVLSGLFFKNKFLCLIGLKRFTLKHSVLVKWKYIINCKCHKHFLLTLISFKIDALHFASLNVLVLISTLYFYD